MVSREKKFRCFRVFDFVLFPKSKTWKSRKAFFYFSFLINIVITQLTFTCSNSTIETLEKSCEICSKLTIKTPERRQ